jgi:hypothetical protein
MRQEMPALLAALSLCRLKPALPAQALVGAKAVRMARVHKPARHPLLTGKHVAIIGMVTGNAIRLRNV